MTVASEIQRIKDDLIKKNQLLEILKKHNEYKNPQRHRKGEETYSRDQIIKKVENIWQKLGNYPRKNIKIQNL